MSRAIQHTALLAALIALACLAAPKAPSHPSRPARRAQESHTSLRIDCVRSQGPSPTSPTAPPDEAPPGSSEEGPGPFAKLALIVAAQSDEVTPLLAELVSLSRRLLQGDRALAQATLAATDSSALSPQVRNLCLLLLAYTEEPRAREVVRGEALSADDDRALLALDAVLQYQQLNADCADSRLERDWASMLLKYPADLYPAARDCVAELMRIINTHEIVLAAPTEDAAFLIAEEPVLPAEKRELFIAVAQSGGSLAGREMAIACVADDGDDQDWMRAIARDERTPDRVKAAVYERLRPRPDDFEHLRGEIQRTQDPEYLAVLCEPLVCAAGARRPEAIALLERLAPLADTNPRLARRLLLAMERDYTPAAVESIERVARSAQSDDLRLTAVLGLCFTTDSNRLAVSKETMEALQRLSLAACPALAAEASNQLMNWARANPLWAKQMTDDAFLDRAGALAQMPAVPEQVRQGLAQALAERCKRDRP